MYNILETVGDIIVRQGRDKIALYSPRNIGSGLKTKKMLEYILKETQIKYLVYVGGIFPERKSGGNTFGKMAKERNRGVLWVKRWGKPTLIY